MAKRKKKSTVIGLDLGVSSVKAVEMERVGEEVSITSCSYEDVSDPTAYTEAIQTVLEAGGMVPKNVVVGMSGRSTLLQTISIPADKVDDIDEAVMEEAEKYIPYDVDEAQVDYHIFDNEYSSQMKCLLAAVRQSDVEDRLEILFSAGITPSRIDVELIALANAFETANANGYFLAEGQPVAIVDFGATKTLITVTDGDAYIFREFPFGGDKLTEMIAHRLGCSMDEAEKTKREPGDNLDVVKDAIYPGIEDITAEIRSCADNYRGASHGRDVELMLLSGGLVNFPGVTPLIGRLARLETRIFDSFGSVGTTELDDEFVSANAHDFIVAFGLACHAKE